MTGPRPQPLAHAAADPGHDSSPHTDLEDWSVTGRELRIDVGGVFVAALLPATGLVVVVGQLVKLGDEQMTPGRHAVVPAARSVGTGPRRVSIDPSCDIGS
jgi:hypothetical protein